MTVYLRAYNYDHGTVREVARPFKFPGGELDLKELKNDFNAPVTWVADVRGADLEDLVTAALLADVAQQNYERFVLMLPYLPAARADRGTPCGASVYARLINAMNAEHVITIDPHSPIMPAQVNNLVKVDPVPLVRQALGGREYDFVIAPDHGAVERAQQVASALGIPMFIAEKKRDFETGQLLSYEIDLPSINDGMRYLAVDDICDGGGTFKLLAKAIWDHTRCYKPNIGLWVTHGIFSGAADSLRSLYTNIYTTDSHPGSGRVGVATTIVPSWLSMHQVMVEALVGMVHLPNPALK